MKKSLILGAAAMATVFAAPVPQADAAEVKLGGYYIFRAIDEDSTIADVAGTDERSGWFQRLHLNLHAKVSDKTSVHWQFRPVGGTDNVAQFAANQANATTTQRLWAESEVYGVGLKVGQMPLNINDGNLFKDNGGSFGTVLLSKSFGDMTVVGLNVRAIDTSTGGATTSDDDEVNVYGLSLLGKAGSVNYQLTWSHLAIDKNDAVLGGVYTADMDNDWIAATVGTAMSGVNVKGTLVYESGLDASVADAGTLSAGATAKGSASQLRDSGMFGVLKADGKTGFGGWAGYGFYASEDFSHPQAAGGSGTNRPSWSTAWDAGVGSRGLFETWAANGGQGAMQDQNMWGIGANVSVKAGAWTVVPAIDYASVVENNVDNAGAINTDSAWGGSLTASTSLDEGTTLSLFAIGLNPSEDTAAANVAGAVENMSTVGAQLKVNF